MEFEDLSIVTETLKKVFVHHKGNKGQFTKEVIESTLRVLTDSSEMEDTKELNEFADSMTEQMISCKSTYIYWLTLTFPLM